MREAVTSQRPTKPGPGIRTLFRAGLPVLLVASLVGCISDAREKEIGDTMAAEVNPHLPIISDPLANAYLNSVGNTIGDLSDRPEVDYTFYLVNTDMVNAFALPGGHVYLTRGLVEKTKTGEEFAGVLAHEIGHVAARHGVQKMQRQLRTGSLVNVLYNTILGGEPELLRENSFQLANVVWSASHSRNDEREADRLAVEYLAEAGVDPGGIVDLLSTLLADERRSTEVGMLETWLSSHPLTAERIDEAERRIERVEKGDSATLDLGAFQSFRDLVLRHAPTGPPDP